MSEIEQWARRENLKHEIEMDLRDKRGRLAIEREEKLREKYPWLARLLYGKKR